MVDLNRNWMTITDTYMSIVHVSSMLRPMHVFMLCKWVVYVGWCIIFRFVSYFDYPSTQIRRLSALDSTWVTNGSNGLQGHAHPAWLHVYLATCKLLHLALTLPATRLPQFQMYRWAFVGDEVVSDGDIIAGSIPQQQITPTFVPYLSRIYKLLRNKVDR